MKKTFLSILALFICQFIAAQNLETYVPTEEVTGICNKDEIYKMLTNSLTSIPARSSYSNEEIIKRLNSGVPFVSEKKKLNDNCILELIISCEGKLVSCKIGKKTRSVELDSQICKSIQELDSWFAALVKGKKVDSIIYYKIGINNGEFFIE